MPPWWKRALLVCSLREWSAIAAGGAVLTGVLSVLWGLTGLRRPWMRRAATAGLAAGAAGAALGAAALYQRQGEIDRAIVTAENAVLRISPLEDAAPAGAAAAGRTVLLEKHHENWAWVRLPGGGTGWLPAADVQRIIPGSL